MEVVGGVMEKMILRNTVIPTKKLKSFTTTEDFQKRLAISIYEGERAMAKDNHKIGEFFLNDIPAAPRGVPSVAVTFEIDVNGILQVTAEDKATKNVAKVTITAETGRLKEEDIARMVREAEAFAKEDAAAAGRVEAKNSLERYVYGLKSAAEEIEDDDDEDEERAELASELGELVEEGIAWLAEHGDGKDISAEAFAEKQKEVERSAGPILRELQQHARKGRQGTGAGGRGGGGGGGDGGGGGGGRWDKDEDEGWYEEL